MKKRIFLIINYVVTAGLMYFVFRQIHPASIAAHMQGLDYALISAAVLVSLAFRLALYPLLWQSVFISSGLRAEYRDLFLVNATSLPLKYAIPFKVTEIVRAAGLKVVGNIDFSLALGTTIMLRLFTVLATACLFLVGAAGLVTYKAVLWSILGILAMLVSIAVIKQLPRNVLGVDFSSLNYCFKNIARDNMYKLFLSTLLMQSGELVTSYLIISAFGLQVPLAPFMYSIGLMMLAGMLPISIQGIGVRETVSMFTLGTFISPGVGIAAAVLLTLIHHVIPAVCGAAVWAVDSTTRYFGAGTITEFNRQ